MVGPLGLDMMFLHGDHSDPLFVTLSGSVSRTAGEHSSSLKMQVRSGLTGTITGENLTFRLTGNAKGGKMGLRLFRPNE
jgi:hypothetical protein